MHQWIEDGLLPFWQIPLPQTRRSAKDRICRGAFSQYGGGSAAQRAWEVCDRISRARRKSLNPAHTDDCVKRRQKELSSNKRGQWQESVAHHTVWRRLEGRAALTASIASSTEASMVPAQRWSPSPGIARTNARLGTAAYSGTPRRSVCYKTSPVNHAVCLYPERKYLALSTCSTNLDANGPSTDKWSPCYAVRHSLSPSKAIQPSAVYNVPLERRSHCAINRWQLCLEHRWETTGARVCKKRERDNGRQNRCACASAEDPLLRWLRSDLVLLRQHSWCMNNRFVITVPNSFYSLTFSWASNTAIQI